MINELKHNEIFIFGSNLCGAHGGGAARQACDQFGAKWGIGEGLTGQCYAFPTLDEYHEKIDKLQLLKSRDKLYETCKSLPEKTFLLTSVGTGIAGFTHEYMKEIFISQVTPENLILPEEWK